MHYMAIKILLLFGGESSEHEVSITSAKNVRAALDASAYDIALCYITKDGRWKLVDDIDSLESEAYLSPVFGQKKFSVTDGTEVMVDVILPILHGAHGEDGDVQGVARLIHVPCVGPSLIGAAISMDKDVTKRLLRDIRVPVVDWIAWHVSLAAPSYEQVVAKLGGVVFVKPANAGSSVGVSKAKTADEYIEALELAKQHDRVVLIERAISGHEIEVAVLGNGDDVIVSTPGEIIPGEEFYSYDDKYSEASTSQFSIPADLPAELIEQIKQYARSAYIATRGQGLARIDFFVDDEGAIYLNEINSIPGFTNISMYPKMMAYDGMSYPQLIDRLISLATEV